MNTTPKDFTERDIRLVASWVHARDCAYDECGPTDDDEDTARAILGALAEAGRLQPQPAAEEYGVKATFNDGSWLVDYPRFPNLAGAEIGVETLRSEYKFAGDDPEDVKRVEIVKRALGPWVEVGSTPEESRDR